MLDIAPRISVPFIRQNEQGKIVVTDRDETRVTYSVRNAILRIIRNGKARNIEGKGGKYCWRIGSQVKGEGLIV